MSSKKQSIIVLCTALLLCSGISAVAQNKPDSTVISVTPFSFTGQIAVSYGYNSVADKSALFVNFGGPAITLKSGDWSFTLGCLPSLRLQQNDLVRPVLGFGPIIGYKHWLLVLPVYFDAVGTSRAYIPTFGIGYRL